VGGARAGSSRSPGLGLWAGLPFAALFLLVLAIGALPGSDCSDSSHGTSAGEVLVAAVACAASVGCIAAGSYRLGALLFGEPRVSGLQVALAAVFVGLTILAAGIYDSGRSVTFLGHILIVGTAATAVVFLVLVVALIARRTVDEAGLFVPLYLLGAGLFVYPIFALLALGASRGAFC